MSMTPVPTNAVMVAQDDLDLGKTLHDTGEPIYSLTIDIAEFLIENIGFFDGPPESVLGIILLMGLILL